ncbi:MAG TPA: glycoside hydrolase family 2 TIM barrel-domain containing protein [Candidatus Dormibacteraeota bacterium]|nr:glycoside hydrolase family 2 TIM barrel-domain containing protein [Candidatus Dormibacteraeota bacterium]
MSIVTPPRSDYPRPRLRRAAWINLNGEWDFGSGDPARFDRRIMVPFCPQSALSGIGHLAEDVVWYRRRFRVGQADCWVLHFGAVDYWATVWVNDVEVARHEGGHTPFSADISAAVADGDNVLVVRAEDPLRDKTIPRGKQSWQPVPEGIFYTPTTGIWQTVWLEPLSRHHVSSLEVRADIDHGAVDVAIEAEGEVQLTARLGGTVVGRWSGASGTGRINLDRVATWSPESPTLYDLEARLSDARGTEADRVESYFGLRTVGTRDGCFQLNGEPYVQRLVLDQGYFPGGLMTAASDVGLRRDIELAKALGFNGARKHQKIEDPRWLYWADVLGFLVWEEMPSFHEFSPDAVARLTAEWTAAVRRDRSHPCVVAWVPANESFGLDGIDQANRASLLVELYHLTRDLDASRPVVSNDGWEHALSDLCTLHDYGTPDELQRRYRSLETALAPSSNGRVSYLPGYGYRGEPMLVSEFGGLKLGASSGWGYREVPDSTRFVETYRDLIQALMSPGPVEGMCCTQLTDVEQERNGLLTADRVPKIDPPLLQPITRTPKER